MKKTSLRNRILSLFLILVMVMVAVPLPALSAEDDTQPPVQQKKTGDSYEIIYILNGGEFNADYTPAGSAPFGETVLLPGEEKLTRPGYVFGGWYDNRALEGEKLTSVQVSDSEIPVYARWTPRNYTVTIPDTVQLAENGSFSVSADCEGFFKDDAVSVSVNSGNDWNLVNGENSSSYTLTGNSALGNGDTFAEFSDDGNVDLDYSVSADPEQIKGASDLLTFDISFEKTMCSVVLNSGPDSEETVTVPAGTCISELPAGNRDGFLFLGWCTDEDCARLCESDYEIISDSVLYGKFIKLDEMKTTEYQRVITSYDQASDFTVLLSASEDMTAEEVKNAIELSNATRPDDEDFFTVAEVPGSDNQFTVSGKGGFIPGCTYKLELKDDSLCFTGYENPENPPREYDFSIYRENVINLKTDDSLIYVPIGEISGLIVNKKSIENPVVNDIIVTSDGDSNNIATDGSFCWNGTLKAGDIVGIYSGNIPDFSQDELIVSDPDVNYIEITGVGPDGRYRYHGAEARDVIFTPDVFPVAETADLDGKPGDNFLRAEEKWFVFADDSMEMLGLNIGTTVDAGDYIAFYTGAEDLSDLSKVTVTRYAEIVSVDTEITDTGVFYILEYSPVEKSALRSSLDTYYKRDLTESEMELYVDDGAVLEEFSKNAENSEFIDSATDYLAMSLLVSDDFADSVRENGEDPDTLTLAEEDGTVLMSPKVGSSRGKWATVEVAPKEITPYVSTHLKYFEGKTGFRMTLKVLVEVVVHLNSTTDLKFEITGEIQQEVRFTLGVSASAEWDNWGPIPYISDYIVSVNNDVYEYSAFEIVVSATTDTGRGGLRGKLGKALLTARDMPDTFENIANSAGKVLGTEDDRALSFDLAEKYSEMIENVGDMDWKEIYSRPVTEDKHFRVLEVIDISLGVDFVVFGKINVTIGNQFYFATAKRNVYTIYVFDHKVENDTLDLEPEVYSYTFYAMGMLGIRAGVRLRVQVGLLDTRVASVGIYASIGAYFEAYGYFYYTYMKSKMNGVTDVKEKYAGALYMELGIFVNISFVTQAGDNLLSYAIELYDNQWPLITFGQQKNMQDFTWDQSDVEELEMKYSVKRSYLPDNLLTLSYLDLKEGADIVNKDKDDEYYRFPEIKLNESDFDINITNDEIKLFTDDMHVEVNPKEGERTLDGEIIITYRKAPLTLTSSPIQRVIRVHWDDLASGYFINFDSLGGSYVSPVVGRYGLKITKPADPVRTGYDFGGWYSDISYSKKVEIPDTIPAKNMSLYAKWIPADTTYTVEHYTEDISGNYNLVEKEVLTAKTGSKISPEQLSYEGYSGYGKQTAAVEADGSTVIRYYYTRNTYTLTFNSGNDREDEAVFRVKYGAPVASPGFTWKGYRFTGWDGTVPDYMPAGDLTFTGRWEPCTDTEYAVVLYVQNQTGGGYSYHSTRYYTGTTGAQAEAEIPEIEGYECTVASIGGKIGADGKTEIPVKYDLKDFSITFNENHKNGAVKTITKHFRDPVSVEVPKRTDYAFTGWFLESSCEHPFAGIMPASDLTVYAGWEKGTGYVVKHYLQAADGTYPEDMIITDYRCVQADEDINSVTVPLLTDTEGHDPDPGGAKTMAVSTDPDNITVFEYHYPVKSYKLKVYRNYDGNSVKEDSFVEYISRNSNFGAPLTLDESRPGYTFVGWFADSACKKQVQVPVSMPAEDVTLYGKWEVITYTVTFVTGNELDNSDNLVSSYNINSSAFTIQPAAGNPGYDFDGWTLDEENCVLNKTTSGQSITILPGSTGNLTLTGKYTLKSYSVTYITGLGTNHEENIKRKNYTVEDSFSVKAATPPEGYTFDGWNVNVADGGYVNSSGYGTEVLISAGSYGALTFSAQYKPKKATLIFDVMEDGEKANNDYVSLTPKSIVLDYDSDLPVLSEKGDSSYGPNPPTRSGYRFAGYYYKDGNEQIQYYYADGKPVKDCTTGKGKCKWTGQRVLKAKWEPLTYCVHFDTGGKTQIDEIIVSFANDTFTMPKGTVRIDSRDYTILGWNTDENWKSSQNNIKYGWVYETDETVSNLNTGSNLFKSDITLHAVWMLTRVEFSPKEIISKSLRGVPANDGKDTSTIEIGLNNNSENIVNYYYEGNSCFPKNIHSGTDVSNYPAEAESCLIEYNGIISDDEMYVLKKYCKSQKLDSLVIVFYPYHEGKAIVSVDVLFSDNSKLNLVNESEVSLPKDESKTHEIEAPLTIPSSCTCSFNGKYITGFYEEFGADGGNDNQYYFNVKHVMTFSP